MKIILLGPSGSGKGTLSDFIRKDFGIPHISTGDLFRENVAKKTPLGILVEESITAGLWISDDVTMRMLMERLAMDDARCGFILDGFPRTMIQAHLLDVHMQMEIVVELDIEDEIVIDRLTGRYVCRRCNKNHNVKLGPVDKCRACGGELYQREDDTQEAIEFRLKQFRATLRDIKHFYREQGILFSVKVEATDSPFEIYERVRCHFSESGILPMC